MIILAVLGLIILFALLYMFMTEQGKTSSTLGSCLAKGGKCETLIACEDGNIIPEIECPTTPPAQEEICCITI